MPRARSRNAYQHVSDFNKGRVVAYRNCGLPYHSIASRVRRDPISVSRGWNRWVQDGKTERRAGSQRLPITSKREGRHITRTVRRRLLHHGLSARIPWLQLPLTLHHRQKRLQLPLTLHHRQKHLQWCDQRRTWCMNGETSFFRIIPGSVFTASRWSHPCSVDSW
ncbi:HTH_Tnp_Tc3_2 domain-containing protein [Trichonephila clavipes]|nr:HTH_Tnp_Tc3_2 domain-containing protein [Trichonephila clavipes]